jgi:hypothetical protein
VQMCKYADAQILQARYSYLMAVQPPDLHSRNIDYTYELERAVHFAR